MSERQFNVSVSMHRQQRPLDHRRKHPPEGRGGATAHWGIEDPATVEGPDVQKERAFVLATRYLKNRISIFINLPIRSLDKMSLNAKLREIGQLEGATRPRPEVA